ncbi:ATP-binding cassette domain-containing protein [Methanogenium marinum]|uniref:ATP-binding cassette domain-containing protein n=1 Tax=Methanogenium marinum TaxID=348610 RepID=A0A9Q4KMD9_9EURY|nr:ATP-binding cassette domain-containing protein [Methanogenium marinum]MDE4907128.1 ATP-binding cassette domain-containing protein [Methanogenium marinum]
MDEEIIRYDNVSIVFDETTIIEHFSLPVNKGEKVILRGPSGSGKSTLLKMAQGYARPDTGTVSYRKHAIDAETAWKIRQETAYISQDTDIGEGIVRDLIAGVFTYASNKSLPYETSLNKYLALFSLDEATLDKDFRTLSGGEKQRIVIIISLLLERTIFFLDEITAALDGRMKQQVADYFLSHKDWTVIAISHDEAWYREGSRIIPVGGN